MCQKFENMIKIKLTSIQQINIYYPNMREVDNFNSHSYFSGDDEKNYVAFK